MEHLCCWNICFEYARCHYEQALPILLGWLYLFCHNKRSKLRYLYNMQFPELCQHALLRKQRRRLLRLSCQSTFHPTILYLRSGAVFSW